MRIGDADYSVHLIAKTFDKRTTTMASSSRGRARGHEGAMASSELGLRLLTQLGPDACEDLRNALEEGQHDMLSVASERFEQRLIAVSAELRAEIGRARSELRQEMTTMDAGIRVALTEGLSKIRVEMTDMRVDVLRWSFLFWIGQVAATATLLAFMLRAFGR